ncbi:MAG TPA: hypothetical protein PLM36_14250, partial [Leptospiraceae bacterium]|nr:hypothetical protein [Leptospiraceae bacterium]
DLQNPSSTSESDQPNAVHEGERGRCVVKNVETHGVRLFTERITPIRPNRLGSKKIFTTKSTKVTKKWKELDSSSV